MTFRSGDIVLVPFPFTDLSTTKRRPALLSESIMLGRIATLKPATMISIHFSMCKAIDCGGFSVMEPTAQAYRP